MGAWPSSHCFCQAPTANNPLPLQALAVVYCLHSVTQVLLHQSSGDRDAHTGQGRSPGPSLTAETAATTPALAPHAAPGPSSEAPCMLSQHIRTPAAQQECDCQAGACPIGSHPARRGRSRQQHRLAVCLLLAALCLASSTLLSRRRAAVLQQEWNLMAAQTARTRQTTTAPAPAQTGLQAASAAASVDPRDLPKTEQSQSTIGPLDAPTEGRNEQMCMAASSSTTQQVVSPAESVRARRRAKQAPAAALLAAGATQIAPQHGDALQASSHPAAACMDGDEAQHLSEACSLQPASKKGNDGTYCCLEHACSVVSAISKLACPCKLRCGLQATMSAFQRQHWPLSTFSRPSQPAPSRFLLCCNNWSSSSTRWGRL